MSCQRRASRANTTRAMIAARPNRMVPNRIHTYATMAPQARIMATVAWVWRNLGWSLPVFAAVLALYVHSLDRLRSALRRAAPPDVVSQADHLTDVWTSLFFGVGVIWTAIGMRGALLEGLGNLNAQSAAKLGAFSILKRLVDGGILLALSTTIVGAVGGYLLRLVKSLAVGTQVRAYYSQLANQQADAVNAVLKSIDAQLNQLVSCAEKQPPEQH